MGREKRIRANERRGREMGEGECPVGEWMEENQRGKGVYRV